MTEKGEFTTLKTHELAVAGAIEKLTSREKTIELLANIDKRDIPRYSLILSIAQDFKLEWLATFVYSELRLTCSVDGKRAEQLVTVAREPDIGVQDAGLFDRLRGRRRR